MCADSKLRTALGLAAGPFLARVAFTGPWPFAPMRPLRTSSFVPCPPARLPGGREGDVTRAGSVVTVEWYRGRRTSGAVAPR